MNPYSKINAFLNKGSQRSSRALKNILAMSGLKTISILCSLIVVPLTIDYLSKYEYGIWLTIFSMVSWLSFFDLGIGNGLRNKFIEAKERGKNKLARIYVSTSYVLIGIIILFVWSIGSIAAFSVDWTKLLNTDPSLAPVLAWTIEIALTNFAGQFVFSLGKVLLLAVQKPALASSFDTVIQIAINCVILILIHTTKGSLIWLALAVTCTSTVIYFITNIWCFQTILKDYRPSWKYVRFRLVRGVMSMGFIFFFIQIINIAYYQTTNIIISHFVGPDEVTVYNIAYKYMFVLTMAFNILITPFWSAYAEARVNGDYLWMKATTRRLVKITGLIVLGGIGMVLVSPWVYKLWIGDKVQIPMIITILVCLFQLFYIWSLLWSNILFGFGKIKLQTIMTGLCVLFYLPIGIIVCSHYGVVGLLSVALITFLIFNSWFGIIQVRKLINGTARGIWNK